MPTARIMGIEAEQMTGTPNHNDHSEITGIFGIMVQNSFVQMRKMLAENYLQFGQ